MVSLAERQVQRPTGALTLGAAFALTMFASLRSGGAPAALPPPSVEPAASREPAPPTGDDCPAAVRAQLHIASPTSLFCIAGNYTAPGYFVHATYDTTETWERYGIVSRDGHVLLPMIDRPELRRMSFAAADLDGDGRDEIVGYLQDGGQLSIDIMAIRGDALEVTSQLIPVERRGWGISFVGHELWIDDAVYRLDRGWLIHSRDH